MLSTTFHSGSNTPENSLQMEGEPKRSDLRDFISTTVRQKGLQGQYRET